jgi:hypothetical protein
MSATGHREPYEARVSSTVLGAPGGGIPGGIPLGDSTAPHVLPHHPELARKAVISRVAVVELIAATTTKTGLTVQCELDENSYAKGIKVTDAEMATLNIETDPWHPEWNYTINPRPTDRSGNS